MSSLDISIGRRQGQNYATYKVKPQEYPIDLLCHEPKRFYVGPRGPSKLFVGLLLFPQLS